MVSVTGRVKPSPAPPARASTSTIASGPYATDAIASRESAARPPTTDRRCRSPVSAGSLAVGVFTMDMENMLIPMHSQGRPYIRI